MTLIHFPFSAVVGQQRLKTALLISAVDPRMGGILITGPRGSAKSTIARSLADLIKANRFVNLPLGASEEKLIGSLDLNKALSENKVEFSEGLLAKADQGVLYVDEVNLLADHLVDVLLDVAASGVNQVERDAISHQHVADFLLVGTMNPDEGELRPQLLDRFGLMVVLNNQYTLAERQEIMQQRLSFDEQPEQFCKQFEKQQNGLKENIESARNALTMVSVSSDIQHYIAEVCNAANVEGLRADITLYRAARAYAALNKQAEVTKNDVDAVSDYVLQHRGNQSVNPQDHNQNHNQNESQNHQQSNTNNGQSQQKQDNGSSIQGSWGAMQADSIPVEKIKPIPNIASTNDLKKKSA